MYDTVTTRSSCPALKGKDAVW